MRTKALLLSAMVCAGSLITAAAQNVYSVNVVGYTTITASNFAGTSTPIWLLIANQLDDGAGNRVTNIFATAPALTQIYKFNPTAGGYVSVSRNPPSVPIPWSGDTSMTMAPGEGVFLKKSPTPAVQSFTFVGEVLQGTLVNQVTPGYDIYSPMVPQEGAIQAVHGYVPILNDQVLKWLPTAGGYQTISYASIPSNTPPRWIPSDPIIKVNEAVWIKSGNNKNWTRTFTVN